MNRPRTGFKQKNPQELDKVNFEDLEKYVDCLYEEDYDVKIQGARSILYLVQDPKVMYYIADEKQNLLDVISRTLRDEHKKALELSIYLINIFYCFSYYQIFHPSLLTRSIGEISMNIIQYNLMKYDYRKDEIIRFSKSKEISPKEFQVALDKFLFLVRKQDRILTMAFKILHHLAEDPKVEVKMVKKDIVGNLLNHMNKSNINLLLEVLLFLKKLSIVQQNKDAMIRGGIFEKLMAVFEMRHPFIWAINLQIFFNLSFDHTFRMKVIQKPEEFYKLTEFFKLTDFRSIILRIFYNFSLEEKAKPLFYNSEALFIIYELLDKFPEKIIGAELAALTLNLISYPPNAQKLADNGRVKTLIERVLKNSDFELMKIVKTIIENCNSDDKINDIYESYIDEHFLPILHSGQETNEYLIETLYILSYINTDWEERIDKYKLIEFFERHLKTINYDEFLIAVISFFGNVSSDKGCAGAIAKSKILEILFLIFNKRMDNLNIVFGIIFALYQMLPWKETKALIVKNEDLIELVLGCLRCENEQINFISMRFLEIVQLYDSKWSEKIKKEKFRLYNNDLINKIKDVQKGIKIMMEQGGMLEDDELGYDMIGYPDDDEIYIDEQGIGTKDEDNAYNYNYY